MRTGPIHTRNVITSYGESSAQGSLTVKEFSSRERTMRGVRAAGTCLGVTLACVLIPAAHFVLVPLGLLLTPVIVWIMVKVRTQILSAQVTCPQCAVALNVLTTQERFPMYETCSQCRRQIVVRPQA